MNMSKGFIIHGWVKLSPYLNSLLYLKGLATDFIT